MSINISIFTNSNVNLYLYIVAQFDVQLIFSSVPYN